jgi:hypothetical protein
MCNSKDPSVYVVSSECFFRYVNITVVLTAEADAHHRFYSAEPDWGFSKFAEVRDLRMVKPGSTKSVIQNDSTTIVVYVKVVKDKTGVLWHNFVESALCNIIHMRLCSNDVS